MPRKSSGVINFRLIDVIEVVVAALNIPRMMCPALMFAPSRNDNVIGRIRLLIPSTSDRKALIGGGLFSGICKDSIIWGC